MDVLYSNSKRKPGNDCRIKKSIIVFKDPADNKIFYRFRSKSTGYYDVDDKVETDDPDILTNKYDFPVEWVDDIKNVS